MVRVVFGVRPKGKDDLLAWKCGVNVWEQVACRAMTVANVQVMMPSGMRKAATRVFTPVFVVV